MTPWSGANGSPFDGGGSSATVVRSPLLLFFRRRNVRPQEPDRPATSEPLIGTPLPLSGVRGTTWQLPSRALSSRTTSSATSYPPSEDGWSCHLPATPTAMTTQTPAGRSAPSGARATGTVSRAPQTLQI